MTFRSSLQRAINGDELTDQERDLHATSRRWLACPWPSKFSDTARLGMRRARSPHGDAGDYLRPMIDENSMTGLNAPPSKKNPVLVIEPERPTACADAREQLLRWARSQFAAISNLSMMATGWPVTPIGPKRSPWLARS